MERVLVRFLGNPVFGDEFHGYDPDKLKSIDVAKGQDFWVSEEKARELIETWPGSFEIPKPEPEGEVETETKPKPQPIKSRKNVKKKVTRRRRGKKKKE